MNQQGDFIAPTASGDLAVSDLLRSRTVLPSSSNPVANFSSNMEAALPGDSPSRPIVHSSEALENDADLSANLTGDSTIDFEGNTLPFNFSSRHVNTSQPRSISLPSGLYKFISEGRKLHTRGLLPSSDDSPKRAVSESHSFDSKSRNIHLNEVVDDASMLTITDASTVSHYPTSYHVTAGVWAGPGKAVQRALSTPDILFLILEELDSMTVVPHELCHKRRKPLSYKHSQLIFGNSKEAWRAWQQNQPLTSEDHPPSGLYNCLFVNSMWHDVAKRVLEAKIHFRSEERWHHFAWRGRSSLSRKPKALVLHKLNQATNLDIEVLGPEAIGGRLEWLEFYTCPNLVPHSDLLKGGNLTRIVLPGCNRVNDHTMSNIAVLCPLLEHLDIRACEQVGDRGLKLIARYCPKLHLLNVGRTRGGSAVTYKAIKHLARQTQVVTLGLAGCAIDDRAIWELAVGRGPHLQRLSLNNCVLLTDNSIPRVLNYMPNLTVLEIRNCTQITHMRPLAVFKHYRECEGQPPLIEGCEIIQSRLHLAIRQLREEIGSRIRADFREWINERDVNDDFQPSR